VIKRPLHPFAFVLASGLSACGGGPSAPPPPPTAATSVVLFYDENGTGVREAHELVELPNVTIRIGTGSGRTDSAGRASVTSTEGAQTVSVDPGTLPPYFQVAAKGISVPATGDVVLPATLPLGPTLIKNKYMAFGDSLTSDAPSYVDTLEPLLVAYLGDALVVNDGNAGTRSVQGRDRVVDSLLYARPAYTLILYGTNDWNTTFCKTEIPCRTPEYLQYMIQSAKGLGSLVFLATMPPVNVGYNFQAPPERDSWVTAMNVYYRELAQAEGVVLVDLEASFRAQPDVKPLFKDYVHLSQAGADLMAKTFFDAITGQQTATTSRARRFGFAY
jgi:lysophospholipase L1-like esterase